MAIGFRPSVDSLGGISNMSPGVPVDQMASTTPFANVPLDKEDRNTLAFREQFVGDPRRQIERLTEQTSQLPVLEKQSEAERTARQAKSGAAALRQERKTIEESDAFKNLKQLEKQTMMSEFVPTKENAQDLSNLFGLVSLIGFTIGMGGKRHAMQAMSAMNGMLEGHRAGREDLYKREKSIFEEQMKTLKQKTEVLTKELERIAKLAATNRAAAEEDATALFAQEGADFYKKHAEKYGALGTLELAKANLQNAEKSFEIILKEREKRDARLDRIAQQMQMFQLKSAHDFEMADIKARLKSSEPPRLSATQIGMAQRAVNSLGGVASAAEALMKLPAGTTTELLPNLQTKEGMINYVRNTIGRKISSRDADMMNTLFTGIGRNLASIEASGAATGLQSLAEQMQKGIYINSGVDDPYKVAFKIADLRRIATENIRPAIDAGILPEKQAATAADLVKRIEKAIPYTVMDVIDAANKGRKTIGETTSKTVQGKSFDNEQAADAAFKRGEIKAGDRVVIGGVSGTWEP